MPAKGREHMDEAAIWKSHLKPGESIVWAESFSPAVRKADNDRTRLSTGGFAIGSGLLAIVGLYRFYEATFHQQDPSNLSSAVAGPLYLAFGVALGILSFFLFRKLKLPPPDADHYAITSERLLAADAAGKLVDQMPGAEIEGFIFDERSPNEMHVMRRGHDDMFFIEHLTDLRAFRTRIRDAFPEAQT